MNKKNVIDEVVKKDMCIGCGICTNVCPHQCIEIKLNKYKEYIPNFNKNKCTNCEICLNYCPHSEINILKELDKVKLNSKYYGIENASYYVGFDKDNSKRIKSASGGVVTLIAKYMLENRIIDFVIHGEMVENDKKDIHYQACISKYKEGNYLLIGVPCIIRGFKKLIQNHKSYKNIKLFTIALSCSHNVNGLYTDYIADSLKIKREEKYKVNLRYKDESMIDANNFLNAFIGENFKKIENRFKTIFTDTWRNYYFAMNVCNYCSDFWGKYSDVSVKDAWGKWANEDRLNKSIIISRNKVIDDIIKNYDNLKYEPITLEDSLTPQMSTIIYKQVEAYNKLYKRLNDKVNIQNGLYKNVKALKYSKKLYKIFGFKISYFLMKKLIKKLDSKINKINYEKNILILGGYGYKNTGDEAQLSSTLNMMNEYFNDYKLIVLTPNLEYTKNAHNCNVDLAPREAFFNSESDRENTVYWINNDKKEKKFISKMKNIYFKAQLKKYFNIKIKNKKIDHLLNLLKQTSLVYYSGGGYLTGKTLSRLFDGCLFISLCKLFSIPVVLSGQTIGLFRNDFDIKIAKKAFSYAKLITLRDPYDSPKSLESIGIYNNYEVMFDDALFCQKEENINTINELLKNAGIKERYITFNMHYFSINDEENKKIILEKLKLIIEYTQKIYNNIAILLIPMVPSDYNEQKEFLEYIKQTNIYLLEYDYDFKKIRSIIKNSLLCITMKHHPIIFALGEKIPVISISYSDYYKHKNSGALKIFELEKYNIELENSNYLELYKNKIIDIKENYEQTVKHLERFLFSLKSKKEEFAFKVKDILRSDQIRSDQIRSDQNNTT